MKRRLRLIKFPKPKIPDDSQFIETLVWVLGEARAGRVTGYCAVVTVDQEGVERTIEFAKESEDISKMTVLGMIERMKTNYIRRAWPEDFMIDKGER